MSKEFIIRKEGRFWRGRNGLDEYMRNVKDGEKIKVVVSKADKRTLQQNDWFHAVLPAIRDALRDVAGYNEVRTIDDAKDVVKSLFFKKEISNGTETIPVIQGTSETTKLDFSTRADDIIKWAWDYLGIQIAPPDHQFEIFE